MKKIVIITFFIIFVITKIFSFDFLVNLFFGVLPQPVRSAFKGQGLENNILNYGFGNSAFATLGYLNSNLEFKQGNFYDEYKFKNPTYYTYAGYIAHVSTPVFFSLYPGWQLELEIGYGGTDYNSYARELTQKFYFSGLSGFNWNIYKSPIIKNYSWCINLGFGYKIHSFLKEQLYYNTQIGIILKPKLLSLSLEYLSNIRGGTFFIYSSSINKVESKEQIVIFSTNLLLNEKFLLKFGSKIKTWYLIEMLFPPIETKINFYGIFISLLTK